MSDLTDDQYQNFMRVTAIFMAVAMPDETLFDVVHRLAGGKDMIGIAELNEQGSRLRRDLRMIREQQKSDFSRAETAVKALELLANKENWSSGDTELYGHFTAREVAKRALKKIRGEEVEP